MSLNIKTGDRYSLIEHLKGLLGIFFNSLNSHLIIISKIDKKLPVIISIYDLHGSLLEQIKLRKSILKTALDFDFTSK